MSAEFLFRTSLLYYKLFHVATPLLLRHGNMSFSVTYISSFVFYSIFMC